MRANALHMHLADPSTPRFPEVRDLMTETKSLVFDPWMTAGNVVVASSYDTLPLPEDEGLFSEVTRLSWNRDGKLEQGQEDFALSRQLTVDEVVSPPPVGLESPLWSPD